jgi:hypothetical protein
MQWQLIPVTALVALAGSYIAWRSWRTWHPPKNGCGGSCGCAKEAPAAEATPANLIPPEQLTMRQARS